MSTELIEKARSGLEAWHKGDVDALSPLLDPEVELTWWEPGDRHEAVPRPRRSARRIEQS